MPSPRVATQRGGIDRLGASGDQPSVPDDQPESKAALAEARRAYKAFHEACFWSHDPDYLVTDDDLPWIAERLMRFGGRRGWEIGSRLCR
jgi:hypothetical protein